MNNESSRLNTFSNWPSNAVIEPGRIAKAGFFYTGQGVEVQCFSCGGKISEWNFGDQVMVRHRRLDPNCPFVVNPQSSGNVAMMPASPRQPESATERFNQLVLQHTLEYGSPEEDDMYKRDCLRLLSFVNWNDDSVSREALVSAGFYHAGEGRLRCAWCGGELGPMRRMGSLGNPLDVHRRYFPGCAHAAMLVARDEAATRAPPAPRTSPPRPPPQAPPPRSPPQTPPPQGDSDQSLSAGAAHNLSVLRGGGTWRALGVVGADGGARHPARASLAARLASFAAWPRDRAQTPHALADAGFFYTGHDDQVRCFYCDGGLGKWEAGDSPWREHARWFPHCPYLLLVKGTQFVDECRQGNVPRTISESWLSSRRLGNVENNRVVFPITENQVDSEMEGAGAAAALGAGLDAARVRRAIARRLRTTGLPFSSSEALIDAVLDDQLNEEPWSAAPEQRLARDILAHTLRDLAPTRGIIPTPHWEERSDSRQSQASTRSLSPAAPSQPEPSAPQSNSTVDSGTAEDRARSPTPERRQLSLEEENRQLKEARLCKVCMDSEVCVVFLPCGHLVSCGRCGGGLAACPLCRAAVSARVRAYLA